MKKFIICILSFLLLFSAVFASPQKWGLTAGVGFAYNSLERKYTYHNEIDKIKAKAIATELKIDYEFENKAFLYGKFAMSFPEELDWKKRSNNHYLEIPNFSNGIFRTYHLAAGGGYDFKLDDNFSIRLGAGLQLDVLGMRELKMNYSSIGLGLTLEGCYKLTERLGLIIAINSSIGLHLDSDTDWFSINPIVGCRLGF